MSPIVTWMLAFTHLLALGLGLGSIWVRGRALKGAPGRDALKSAFMADTWWGIAALVWIPTGLARLFMSSDKPLEYYLANHLFWTKMALLLAILALEVAPMLALIRWRKAFGRGETPDTAAAGRYAAISEAQAWLVVFMVLAATAMARGFGARG